MIGISWRIEENIQRYFDNIDHHILATLIKEILNPDQTIMNLIWKFFRAGYMEIDKGYQDSFLGVPQGGIISPILSNL
jgi:retron-type reverse transcriptase